MCLSAEARLIRVCEVEKLPDSAFVSFESILNSDVAAFCIFSAKIIRKVKINAREIAEKLF